MVRMEHRWRARWIWADCEPVGEGRQVVATRRVFDLVEPPTSAPTRTFAEAAYVLFVNGTEVARGPGRGNPRMRRYDVTDLAPFLVPGPNVVTLLGVHHGRANAWWMPGPTQASALARGGLVLEADLGDEGPLVTDATWRGRVLDGWTTSAPTGLVSRRGRELVDLRALPADLHAPEPSEASAWRPVVVRSGATVGDPDRVHPPSYPFGPTRASPLTPQTLRDRPLARRDERVFALDEVGFGTLVVTLDGRAGDHVALAAAERLDADGHPVAFEEEIGLAITAAEGRRTVETLDRYGLRAVTVDAPPSTRIESITLRERLHPVGGACRFACSDPLLEQIFSVGRRTVSLCSTDAYLDCPTREQRAWTGDSVVHQMVDLTTNQDWTLARWHPRLAASPRADGMLPMAVAGDIEASDFTIIPDWALHWVRSVWNLYRYVGDPEEIASLLPVVERVVDWFEPFVDPATGLPTDVPGWVIIDWASVPTEGASAPLVGLLARALRDFAEMATFVGDGGRAARARARHRLLVEAFEQFWDPSLERYADTLVDERPGATASQHGQAAAIVGGLAPADRLGRLVDLLTDETLRVHATFSVPDGPAPPGSEAPIGGAYLLQGHPKPWWDTQHRFVAAQPFFRYVVHDALAEAGRADCIAGALRDWRVLLDRCPTSWSECWFGGTTSHGWSSTPTRDLVTRVLGVTPAEPGFRVACIAPALGDLQWAEGVVPTPYGPLSVRVEPDRIDVDSPIPVLVEGRRHAGGRHAVRRAGGGGSG